MGLNWAITGGLGFVGINLILRIINSTHFKKITVIDNESGKADFNKKFLVEFLEQDTTLKDKIKIYNIDISDYNKINQLLKDQDILIHLAAAAGVAESIKSPLQNFFHNVQATVSLLNNIRHFKNLKIIVASSGAVLGNSKPPFNEKTAISPISPYGASKASIEQYCKAFSFTYGLNIICCRFSNVFGPFSTHKKTVIRNMFETAINSNEIHITGSGYQTRDFLYIQDLADAIILICLEKKIKEFDLINISTSKETSIIEVAEKIKMKIQKNLETKIKIKYIKSLKGEVSNSFSEYKHLKKLTNWKPVTNLSEGLDTTISWFNQNL